MLQPKSSVLLGFCLISLVSACRMAEPTPPGPEGPLTAASPGKVDGLTAFDAFIASGPTAEAFRARYPGVLLVLPGDISTRELRSDRSRYFADLDEQQRIRGGRFQ